MIKVIDNFLPISYVNAIEKLCYSEDMKWIYCNETIYTTVDKNDLWNKQLSHVLFLDGQPRSEHYRFFMPLLYILEEKLNYKIKTLLRYKINLTTIIPDENLLFLPHVDYGETDQYYSAVFYINDSDGDTVIYENTIPNDIITADNDVYKEYLERIKKTEKFTVKERVNFKRNRLVVSDGKYLHEGKYPTRHKDRIVANIVFK